MRPQRWLGVVCCCLLFLVIFLSLRWNMLGTLRRVGHPELGLLMFILPGIVASLFSRKERVIEPLIGVMIALPLCVICLRTVFISDRSFWQEAAWLFSAVFWTALGSVCFLTFRSIRRRNR